MQIKIEKLLCLQAMGTYLRGRLLSADGVPTPSTEERCATSIRESHEGPVLMAINAERRKQGGEPFLKLTVRDPAAPRCDRQLCP